MSISKTGKIIAKNTLFKVFSVLNKYTRKNKKKILIYSPKELSDNSLSLFEYLIKEKYNEQYYIYCASTDHSELRKKYKLNNVYFVNCIAGVKNYFTSNFVFYSFGKIPISPSKQRVVQLWHGMFFKDIDVHQKKIKKKENFYTDVMVTSELFKKLATKVHSCNIDVVKICGQSRTDIFFKEDSANDKKYIVWLPTFRQSKVLGYSDSNSNEIRIGDYSFDELKTIDNELGSHGIELVVKIHPMQILPEHIPTYKKIKILTEKRIQKEGVKLYELLRDSSALVTDYSSVFYDYYMLDKPIAFCVRDFEEYKEKRGFIVENPLEYLKGKKIEGLSDMIAFIHDVANNKDSFRIERNEFNKKVNTYCDGNNSRRLLEKVGIYK